MDLREKIADEIENWRPYVNMREARIELADRVLAIPEIKEALAYVAAVDSAHPVFSEIREMLDKQR